MFITFEGIEGSGKGTMLAKTVTWLKEHSSKEIVLTREPGGSVLGKNLRSILLDAKNTTLCPKAELFLYLADRAQHVEEIIRPALGQGKIVISDRYADSTIVYQGFARGLDIEELFMLNNIAVDYLWPEFSFVLDLEVQTSIQRARARNKELGIEEAEGRFEAENIAFHNKVRQGYLDWSKKHSARFCVINAEGSPDEVFSRLEDKLREIFL